MASPVLVFVPGLTGSVLKRIYRFWPSQTIWINPGNLLAGRFADLAIDIEGDTMAPKQNPYVVGGQPVPYYYGFLLTYLSVRGWDVRSPDLDWRKSYHLDGQTLANFIIDLNHPFQLYMLCHSRGGLVIRSALKILADRGRLDLVKRVVGLGVPHRGSLNAVLATAGGDNLAKQIEGLGLHFRGAIGTGLGLQQVRVIMRTWVSILELLPDPVRGWLAPAIQAGLYLPATWAGVVPAPIDSLLRAARDAWSLLPDPPAPIEWIDVAGYGSGTYDTMASLAYATDPRKMGYTDDGDGTVPIVSAAIAPRPRILTPTAHDSLPLDGRLFPIIHSVLTDGSIGEIKLLGSVLNALS